MSPEDISENGESRAHLGELQGSLVMVFNATFNNFSVISGCQFYWWKKPEYPEKTISVKVIKRITLQITY